MSPEPAPFPVLVICTANVCRSPVVERLLPRQFSEVGLRVSATSAGTHGGRNLVHPYTVDAATEVGVDLHDHVSRRLTRRLLDAEGGGLVVALTREHLYQVVATDEATWPRTFTLPELARRAERLGGGSLAGGTLGDWVALLARDRTTTEVFPGVPEDDVADPYGRARRHHRAMVREVGDLCDRAARAAANALGVTTTFRDGL